jgi:hypothetical protein
MSSQNAGLSAYQASEMVDVSGPPDISLEVNMKISGASFEGSNLRSRIVCGSEL